MNLQDDIARVVASVPAHAKLIEASGYRDDDLGSDVGVVLEFDTGHLEHISIPSAADAVERDLADAVGAGVIALLEVRRAVETAHA